MNIQTDPTVPEPWLKERVVVLAGNREQFETYLVSEGLTDSGVVYGDGPESVMGRHFSSIVVIGTFWGRKDADKLYDLAQTRVFPPASKLK